RSHIKNPLNRVLSELPTWADAPSLLSTTTSFNVRAKDLFFFFFDHPNALKEPLIPLLLPTSPNLRPYRSSVPNDRLPTVPVSCGGMI
ncbi:hypothetical protein N7463_004162, partial [Penicillium fimorum]